jgi:hypothetical protein
VKKIVVSIILSLGIISLLPLLIVPLCTNSCIHSYSGGREHEVILVLMHKDGTNTRKTLTAREKGSTIYNPSNYKIFPSLINGYVVENDVWYSTEYFSKSIYFPYTMPDKNLELYAKVRPLTNFANVNFANSSTIKSYFSANATFKDEWGNIPSENSETSYYEISEYSVASIKNIIRYYPAKQEIMLLRGYSTSNNMGGLAFVQDEFSIRISINLSNKNISCKGVYTRTGMSSSSASGGTVTITYNVDKISIDDATQPLFPNFATINYSHVINNATNYSKMQELWDSDGRDYANNCYSQANTLLNSLNKRILVLY